MIHLQMTWWTRPRDRSCSGKMVALLLALLVEVASAHASVALLMEEPFGRLGVFNPTGHAAVYLNHVCAESLNELRMCEPGEYGVVISRYHNIGKYDWIAIPLIPYLYAVDDSSEVPGSVDKDQVARLRDAYRREHLEAVAPDNKKGKAPRGEWNQLVGSSYDRTIHGFQVTSTPEQDRRFIAVFNDRHEVRHFNLLFRNCADFSREVIDLYLPHVIHRNFIADLGLMTPKQVSRSLMKYGNDHPEVEMFAFVIPQVPGTVKRSHAVRGVTESLVKSKKYLLPMAILVPAVTGGIAIAYLSNGRMTLPKDAAVFNVDDAVIKPEQAAPDQPTGFDSEGECAAPYAFPYPTTYPALHGTECGVWQR